MVLNSMPVQNKPLADEARSRHEYHVEVDGVTAAEWSDLLEAFADANIYQTWAYGAVRWQEKNLSHLVLKRGAEIVAMAQLRIIRPGALRLGVAYLRWGPLCQRQGTELDPEVVQRMACALHDEYVVKRRLHLEILPNAFSGSFRGEAFQNAFAAFRSGMGIKEEQYRTFVLDLSPPIEELRKRLDPKWRNKLNGAEKNGLRIEQSGSTEMFGIFRKMYGEMLARKKFNTTINIDEFSRIQDYLPTRHRMEVLICLCADEPVAGIVCSSLGDSAIYLLGATSDRGLTLKGAYLLQWEMIRKLRERGVRYYDLGGIDPVENPGVYSFKSGLSGADMHNLDSFVACENGLGVALVKAHQFVQDRFKLAR